MENRNFSNNRVIKTINNNHVILPEPSEIQGLKQYLQQLRPPIENKTFQDYINELYEDIENFPRAIQIVIDGIINKKKIAIIGDYDVDGTIGTSIFIMFFRWLNNSEKTGINLEFPHIYHIPNRFSEGYGPSMFAINKFIDEKVELIITVDSGTTAKKELELAAQYDIDTIVLDHHIIPHDFPTIAAFVNCQNSKNFKYLSGGGVAFVFLIHIQKALKILFPSMNSFNFNEFTDLVALSTVCDFVPFTGLNRLLVQQGLKKFNSKYNGDTTNHLNGALDIILQYTMYYYNDKSHIRATDLGFAIGPYINVAGRMADGNLIVEFFTSDTKEQRESIFFQLQSLWQDRRKLQEEILLSLDVEENQRYVLVYGENIHEGIMGIIAAQLKDKYNKPSIVICVNGEMGKGSIRSISPFNASTIIEQAIERNILLKGGGHAMAGGFVISMDKMADFQILLTTYMEEMYIPQHKDITVDIIVPISEINSEFYDFIHSLGPYGVSYGEPNILFPHLIIKSIYTIGGKHLNLRLMNIRENIFIKAMWFFAPIESIELLRPQMLISIVGNMKMSNGKIEIYILDTILEK